MKHNNAKEIKNILKPLILKADWGTHTELKHIIEELTTLIDKVREDSYKAGEDAGKLYMSMMNKEMMFKVYSSDTSGAFTVDSDKEVMRELKGITGATKDPFEQEKYKENEIKKKAIKDFVAWFNTQHFEEAVTYDRYIATDEHKKYLQSIKEESK